MWVVGLVLSANIFHRLIFSSCNNEKIKHVSQVMDMEHELNALRLQLAEKSMYSLQLRKEVFLNPITPVVDRS